MGASTGAGKGGADVPAHVLKTIATLVCVPTGSLYTSMGVFTLLVTSSMTGF